MTATINVAIIEDNADNIEILEYTLAQLTIPVKVTGIGKTDEEAYHILSDQSVELAFLDIQLRNTTIFTVLEKLYKEGRNLPELVFLTAHGTFENALKAIQFACLDFVTKPFSHEDIEHVVQRFLNKRGTKQSQSPEIGFLLQLLRNDIQSPKTMAVPLQRGIIEIVDLANMLYIEADENISIVHLSNNQKLHSSKNFGHYLSLLTDKKEFVQIGKSCLVNLNQVKQYNHQDKSLRLKNNESLVVSHRFSKSLHKYLLNNQKDLVSQGMFDFLKGLFKS
jgi:DNA-binding LytR/AlgR family response regulator